MIEKVMVCLAIISGWKIGLFHGDMVKVAEDAEVLQPNFFISVPRIYNRITDAMSASIRDMKGFKKKLIDKAIKTKLQNLKNGKGYTHGLWDKLVFGKFKAK